MFFGPAFTHITGAHGAVGAVHAYRAHVDVAGKHGHHQQGGCGVHHVGDLHVATQIGQAGQQFVQHQA